MQAAHETLDSRDERRALRALLHMRSEGLLVGGREGAFQVFAEPRFDLFTGPVHGSPRAKKGALPSAGGCAPFRCDRG